MTGRTTAAALIRSINGPVALIYAWPVLIQSLVAVWGATPWVIGSTGLVCLLVAFGSHYVRIMRLNAALSLPEEQKLRYVEATTIRTIIATANVGQKERQAAGTLIKELPGLEHLHLVVGDSDVQEQAALVESLQEYARSLGHKVIVHARPVAIAPWEVREETPAIIRRCLNDVPPDDSTWVDVTGGTVAMSLAVARAVEGTGHRMCYLAMDRTQSPPIYYGIVDVTPPLVVA